MVAAKMATISLGDNLFRTGTGAPFGALVSQDKAALLLNVGRRSVQRAREVRDKGTEALIVAVDGGKIAVSVAAKLANLAPAAQAYAAAYPAKAAHIAKLERRQMRESALAGRQRALPNKTYGVILADPEWRFEPWSRESGMDLAADNHYPTSETADIERGMWPRSRPCASARQLAWRRARILATTASVRRRRARRSARSHLGGFRAFPAQAGGRSGAHKERTFLGGASQDSLSPNISVGRAAGQFVVTEGSSCQAM